MLLSYFIVWGKIKKRYYFLLSEISLSSFLTNKTYMYYNGPKSKSNTSTTQSYKWQSDNVQWQLLWVKDRQDKIIYIKHNIIIKALASKPSICMYLTKHKKYINNQHFSSLSTVTTDFAFYSLIYKCTKQINTFIINVHV